MRRSVAVGIVQGGVAIECEAGGESREVEAGSAEEARWQHRAAKSLRGLLPRRRGGGARGHAGVLTG